MKSIGFDPGVGHGDRRPVAAQLVVNPGQCFPDHRQPRRRADQVPVVTAGFPGFLKNIQQAATNANVATAATANANSAAHTAAGAETSPPQPETRQLRVLVVEDDPDLNRQLVAALTDAGYAVDSAKDGEEGLDLLGRSDPFEIVITDLGMPGMSGWDLVLNINIHTAHHRGYADVYLRDKGITPPTYAV